MPSEKLDALLLAALEAKELRQSTVTNIRALLGGADAVLYTAVVFELAEAKEWAELNDRFFRTLAFGTGGLRGRTIGKIVTESGGGTAAADQPPEFPCVGTNAMNFHNVGRATRGLVTYLKEWRAEAQTAGKPLLVIAHDTRHYSKDFTELAARIATENGCDAAVFEGPRSTPELAFAVRHLAASAGVFITASHNPPHDNGFKAYFNDGAQVIEPHASAIIARVNAIAGESYASRPAAEQGVVEILGPEVDEAYMERVQSLILNRELVR